MLNTKGCLRFCAKAINYAIPEEGKVMNICTSTKQKKEWIQMCNDNIKFAKTSLLIHIYCGCSSIDWDEEEMRKRIVKKNKEEIERIGRLVIRHKYICEACGECTERKGITIGLKQRYFCNIDCERQFTGGVCKVEGCNRQIRCDNLCFKHYQRRRKKRIKLDNK